MGEILIGTSGYSYDDWVGPVYPEDLPKYDWLKYYSIFFPFVELNFSYYRMPEAHSLLRMGEGVPKGFKFSIKAHKSLTHEVGSAWRDDAAAFVKEVAPFMEVERLAAVIVQLPYRFHYTPENRIYLSELLSILSPFPLAVEFRNSEWVHERVLDQLKSRGIGFVCTDEPDLPGLPPRAAEATSWLGYLRFHGRNAGNWWEGDNVSRYDYLYSEDELREWLPKIRVLAEKTKVLLVAFNNHHKGQAVRNAKEMKALLDARLDG
jgi:uncharacterized protein YecE (DUF72 family)